MPITGYCHLLLSFYYLDKAGTSKCEAFRRTLSRTKRRNRQTTHQEIQGDKKTKDRRKTQDAPIDLDELETDKENLLGTTAK